MKRGILLATMMITAAGVASANLLTTQSQSVASPVPRAEPAAVVAAPVVATTVQAQASPPVSPPSPDRMVAAPVAQKPSVEMRQAPVPLLVKARPAINLPASDDKAAETKATETKPGDTPAEASTDDAAAEKAAAKAIEADGYKGVKVLRKGADGVWHASALRGKTTVMLTVDANGSVTSD